MSWSVRYQRAVPYILALYLLAVVGLFVYFNLRLKVEWVALILFFAAILSGRALLFVKDWGVFLLVLVAWQLASPLATHFHYPWHLTELISADKAMFFGNVPALWLQQHLYHPGVLEPWDVAAAVFYMLHFLAPLAAGFILWMTNRELFARFAVAFVVVAVAGFATYIFYPAVPPWMAAWQLAHVHGTYVPSHHGHVYLRGVYNLFDIIAGHWYSPNHGSFSLMFLHMSYDNVGAMPSEHAAYPMLFFLFLRRQFGRRANFALLYIVGVVFSIMYLGQHFFIDALVGFAYAYAGYALVMHAAPAFASLWCGRRRVNQLTPVMVRSNLEEA